jgi:polyisoprenoid-binding protein YceI
MHMMTRTKWAAAVVPMLATLVAANCARTDETGNASGNASGAADSGVSTQVANGEVATLPAGALQLVVAPEGNQVRYRIREQLVGVDLPNDAVGATGDVSGGIAFDAAGKVLPSASKFVVNVATLKSDKDRRDGYVRGRILGAAEFPTVELAPTAVRGISLPLPTTGTSTFQLLGDLTVRGVTRPTTWQVDAKFESGKVTGTATTTFTFAEFGLQQPRVPVVLSVDDSIKLEYDFSLVPKQ